MLSNQILFFRELSKKLTAGKFKLISEKNSIQTYYFESTNFTFDLEISEARIHSRLHKKHNLYGNNWKTLLKVCSSSNYDNSNLDVIFWIGEKILDVSHLKDQLDEIDQIEIASAIFPIQEERLLSSTLSSTLDLTEFLTISASENIKLDEGEEYLVLAKKYERSPLLRKLAIQLHGVNCVVCNFNFEKAYGSLGKDFIHIHHIERLADTGKKLIDPKIDLVPVCPNCHSMLHTQNPPLKPSELAAKLKVKNNG